MCSIICGTKFFRKEDEVDTLIICGHLFLRSGPTGMINALEKDDVDVGCGEWFFLDGTLFM